MKAILIVSTLLSCITGSCFGQDTLKYCRINSPYSSECYTFYKKDVGATSGEFKFESNDDNGRCSYGIGSFTATKKKIFLSSFSLRSSACWMTETGKPFNNIPSTTLIVPSEVLLKRKNKLIEYGEQKIIYAPISTH